MKLVEIPIGRFQAEAPLARDTYLFLPLNNKTIRIGLAGGVLSGPMLSRLLSKGHTHLRIGEESDIDPELFAVHLGAEETPGQDAPSPAPPSPEIVSLNPPGSPPPAETVISPETDPIVENVVAAGAPAPTEEGIVTKESQNEEPSQSFASEAAIEEVAKIGGALAEEEAETKLSASSEEDEKESLFSNDEEDEETQTISRDQEEKEHYVRKFAAEKDPLPAVIRLQQRLAEAKDEELTLDLSAEKESALKEARAVILSSKISEKIISLSEQARNAEPKLRESLRGQVRSLKSSLDQVDSGDLSLEEKAEFETKEEIASVVESLASASEAEQVEEITERLSAHALTRELALAAIEEQEGQQDPTEPSRGAGDRGLPATVSRLAAYLGHSLGYTNVDFLADLACSAIVHFAKKDGESLNEELLPPFTKRVIFSDDALPDETIVDSREILQFLDAYIDDKECDRSHKDLMKRVFDRTMRELSERSDGPSPWTLKKWSSFVDRGPTMDSHSICTRASAKAVKYARNAVK